MASNDIKQAASLLRDGKLVAFPTETVYGLGGNALSDAAVAAIYAAKGRPQFNPLIVHVPSLEAARNYAVFNESALALAGKFWPGPLTLVLPRQPQCGLSFLVSAGLDTVAIRVPAHKLAQALLQEAGIPVAAPSANRSGRISPTEAAHVREELGDKVDMILDGGLCSVGIESTVVDCTGEELVVLRPGGVTEAQLFRSPLEGEQTRTSPEGAGRVVGGCQSNDGRPPTLRAASLRDLHSAAPPQGESEGLRSPGQLASHYAPTKPLRLNATIIHPGEALLALGSLIPPLAGGQRGELVIENLSPSGSLQEAAANLFSMLRRLDASAATSIAVMPIPEEGLGVAINDRLRRAASVI